VTVAPPPTISLHYTRPVRRSLELGNRSVDFVPHHVEGIGPHLFLIIHDLKPDEPINLTPDSARRFADMLKIAACEAEALEKKAARRKDQSCR
jgi:hypothetical protein